MAIYAKAGIVALGRPISDYYVAGRLVPALFNGMAIAIGLIGVLAFPALAGALSQGGDEALLLLLGGGGAILLIAFLLAPYLRKFGGYTIPDFLGERFAGTGVRPLAVLAVILCSFPALALSLLGLGAIFMRIFDASRSTGIGLGMGIVLLCSIVAGMRSVSLTQIIQYAVLLAVSAAALAISLSQQGTLFLGAADLDQAFAAVRLESFAVSDPLNRFALFFCLAAGTTSLPHLLLRGLVTPSIEEARPSFLWVLPFAGVLCLVWAPYVSIFGAGPDVSSDLAAILSSGLTATGAISVLLAAASGLLIAVANALSYDIYYKGLHRSASTDQRILVARASIFLVAALASFAALKAPGTILQMTGAAFSLAASAFLPALLLGIWWKRATPEGALAGMLAGLAVCLYYMLAPRYIPFVFYETSSFFSDATPDAAARYAALRQNYYLAANELARQAALIAWQYTARTVANWGGVKGDFAALFAVPVGLVTMIGVSLFTPAPSRDVQSFVEELRKPSVA